MTPTVPIWLEYVKAIGPLVVAMIAGGIAAYIAWRQWQTAHEKVMLDLFDRRFAVIEEMKSQCVAYFGESEEAAKSYDRKVFAKARDKSRFLFGKEIYAMASDVHESMRRGKRLERRRNALFKREDSQTDEQIKKREEMAAEIDSHNRKVESLIENMDMLVLPYMLMKQRHHKF